MHFRFLFFKYIQPLVTPISSTKDAVISEVWTSVLVVLSLNVLHVYMRLFIHSDHDHVLVSIFDHL